MKSFDDKIIIYNSLNIWWSYQLTLESFFRHKEYFEKAKWINIANKNKKKYEMNQGDYLSSFLYQNVNKNLAKINKKYSLQLQHGYLKVSRIRHSHKFETVDDLRNFTIDNFNIGALVHAQICGITQSTSYSVSKNIKLIEYFIELGINVYRRVLSDIDEIKPKKIVVINDRILNSAAAIYAAYSKGVDTKIIYWGSSPEKYIEYSKSLFSSNEWWENINDNWEKKNYTESDKHDFAKKFVKIYSNLTDDSMKFQNHVIKGNGYRKKSDRRLVVFYSASEWEHSAVNHTQSKTHAFADQYHAFRELAEILIEQDWEVVLKLHPLKKDNMGRSKQNEWEIISDLERITILQKETTIDTYKLMEQSDLNIVWESSVGLECIARGLPLLVVGKPYWGDKLNLNRVENAEEAKKFINAEKYVVDINKILPWFAYQLDFGENFKYISLKNYEVFFGIYPIVGLKPYLKILINFKKKFKEFYYKFIKVYF
jgi:hypothetical protein